MSRGEEKEKKDARVIDVEAFFWLLFRGLVRWLVREYVRWLVRWLVKGLVRWLFRGLVRGLSVEECPGFVGCG